MLTRTGTGWTVFIAALGMMAGLEALDVSKLSTWGEATTPAFAGLMLAHFGVVAAAFSAGKLIPPDPMSGGLRRSDPPAKEP